MICAYDENMVANAQDLLGGMMDFAVYGLKYEPEQFYEMFLNSVYAKRLETGNSGLIMGSSGIEVCYEVTGNKKISPKAMKTYEQHAINGRSREYWSGWILAYYQWVTSFSFKEIEETKELTDILKMYDKYHEMDVSHFTEHMIRLYKEENKTTQLKKIRTALHISQSELAATTGIPLKTLQQYEQRQKNINHAQVDYLVRLSKGLSCSIEMLMEKVDL